jgi:hypothetical protein
MNIIWLIIFVITVVLFVLAAFSGIKLDGHTLIRLLNADVADLSFDMKTESANGVLINLLSGLMLVLRNGILRLVIGGLMAPPLFGANPSSDIVSDASYHNVQLKRKDSTVYLIVDGKIQESVNFSGTTVQKNVILGGTPCDDSQNFIGSIKNINSSYQVIQSAQACSGTSEPFRYNLNY